MRRKEQSERAYQGPEQRFWDNVNKTPGLGRDGDCWEWTASLFLNTGYGRHWANGKSVVASRFSYEIANQTSINNRWLFVLHSCDNRKCVNPLHLRLGTPIENMDDRRVRNRCANSNKTCCSKGHEYTAENTWLDKHGWRKCRECNRGKYVRVRGTDMAGKYRKTILVTA